MLFDMLWNKIRAHADRDVKKQDKPPVPEIHVTDKASARLLFRRYSGNSYAIEKECSKETLDIYHVFADSDTKKVWAKELCCELLEAIAEGSTPCYEAFQTVNSLMDYYLYDPLAELYTRAWFAMLDTDPDPKVGCILKYLELYTSRFPVQQAADIIPLLDKTEAYLQKHAPEKLKQSRYSSHEGHFRELCADVRRIARENAVTESRFSFVKTPPGALDTIHDALMAEYGDMDTVKEETASLNCAYGVQFEKIFLTGSNDAAESVSLQSWDIPEYIAVLSNEHAIKFRCIRKDDGSFGIDPYYIQQYPPVKAYEKLLTEAVSAYRNRPAHNAFLNTLGHWGNYMAECQERYLSQFPKIMRDIYARIPDCSITDALTQMVDYAEAIISDYGSENICFKAPAAKEEIADWEHQKNVYLPREYRQFLEFANGVSLPWAIEFFGLPDIDLYKKYLDKEGYSEYHHIGSFIGDGTCLCFSEKDRSFYEWQDGEMTLMGNFADMVGWVCNC